ncbi:hypothetical protein AB833_06690 [Chromatiales bacterium (ex Bugula neritina AB1)]|nr:hypothetical protein AB833_06690 [Chromatiales bacterium (ex Bugula neritina AB1)]
MDQTAEQLLARLRDPHLPPSLEWWPPAPGWWLLAALVILLVVLLVRWRIARRKPHWRKSALQILDQLDARRLHTAKDCSEVLSDCSILMRRVAIAVRPREEVAQLTEAQWLSTLDSISGTDQYSAGGGRLLVRHPYMAPGQVSSDQVEQLLQLMRRTINASQAAPAVSSQQISNWSDREIQAADLRLGQLPPPPDANNTRHSAALSDSEKQQETESTDVMRYKSSGSNSVSVREQSEGHRHVRI